MNTIDGSLNQTNGMTEEATPTTARRVWSPGLSRRRRRQNLLFAVQAGAVTVVGVFAPLLAYLMLYSWPRSLGFVRTSDLDIANGLSGFLRTLATEEFTPYLPLCVLTPLLCLIIFRWLMLFQRSAQELHPFAGTFTITKAAVLVFLALELLTGFYLHGLARSHPIESQIYLIYLGLALFFGQLLAHSGILLVLDFLRSAGMGKIRLAIVAAPHEVAAFTSKLNRVSREYALAGAIAPVQTNDLDKSGVPWLGTLSDLPRIINSAYIDELILATDPAMLDTDQRLYIAQTCWRLGVELKMVQPFYPSFHTRSRTSQLGELPLLEIEQLGLYGTWPQFMKRAVDILVSLTALILLSPLLLLTALLIRLESPGPVLFVQDRLGLNGRFFRIYKFRSMYAGADESIHREAQKALISGQQPALADESGKPLYGKVARDPRITRVGRFIRRTSIDELPQLWNVLLGDMSLVGPRPATAYDLEQYSEQHMRRLAIRPGITGIWQVSGKNRLTFEEMVRLDIQYIEQWSLLLDFRIMLRTVPVVLGIGENL